jgi:hypothetical protein
MDLRMLAYFLGRERGLDQITELARDADLSVRSATPIRKRTLIEFVAD